LWDAASILTGSEGGGEVQSEGFAGTLGKEYRGLS